ncbi:MAG: L-serine ammonia-lyase, iron-sulfur-dependent subunit beta [Eubacteriales bacterium]|nr:L-serine ammonia-lyase, iron-sulfur-dependent subunit beta [Eubacteriales bacterium]
MKYLSVTEIIGPVMVGPSSSHTAGAVRIGQMARSIYGGQAREAEIYFYGSFAHTFKGHGTDVAVIAGLLGFSTFDERIPQALEEAEQAGLKVTIIPTNEPADHPNTARIILKGELGQVNVVGISIGGGNAQITEIDGFRIQVNADMATSIIMHQDKAGVIASITDIYGKHGINIGHMEVSRKAKGDLALMSLETDEEIDGEVIAELRALPYMHKVIQVRR